MCDDNAMCDDAAAFHTALLSSRVAGAYTRFHFSSTSAPLSIV
jgi:hypothetical protein